MEEVYTEPKYTFRWLCNHSAFALGVAFFITVVAFTIASFATERESAGLLPGNRRELVAQSATYCFAVVSVTLLSLMLVELAFRKSMSYLHYGLVAAALCLFNLLLLAMAEQMPFWLAYVIVSVMTISLICCFVKGITQNIKAVSVSGVILFVEYALMLVLIYMGSLSLLIGSLVLFVLIAVAMYFTLKLKVENEEIYLK